MLPEPLSEIVVFSGMTASGTHVSVRLKVDVDGTVTMAGQDLGGTADIFHGGEVEEWITVPATELPKLLTAVSKETQTQVQPKELPDRLCDLLGADAGFSISFRNWLTENGIDYRKFVYYSPD